MADETLVNTIVQNAAEPSKATGDSGTIEQQDPLKQIAVDEYQRALSASRKKKRGVMFSKIVPPGTY